MTYDRCARARGPEIVPMPHPTDDRPPAAPLAPAPPATLTRRELLKAGTVGTVGLAAAAGALGLPAWRRLGAQDPAPAGHDTAAAMPEHGSHALMNAVGDI